MTGDPRDALLHIGDTIVDELVELAQRLPTDRVRFLALASARACGPRGRGAEVPTSSTRPIVPSFKAGASSFRAVVSTIEAFVSTVEDLQSTVREQPLPAECS
jgi:hypothetical protein